MMRKAGVPRVLSFADSFGIIPMTSTANSAAGNKSSQSVLNGSAIMILPGLQRKKKKIFQIEDLRSIGY